MKKYTNLINNILLFVLTIVSVIVIAIVANSVFGGNSIFLMILFFLIGMTIFCVLNVLLHEIGHIIAGNKNEFEFISTRLLFITIVKINGKYQYYFSPFVDEVGLAEMVPKHYENINKRYIKTTRGGMVANFILIVLGIIPLALAKFLPFEVFCLLAPLFSVSLYSFLSNALPMTYGNVKNDGAILLDLKKDNDSAKVLINILKIHAELYNGKTPANIDESLYFDIPQLPEDDVNFIIMLTNLYAYYLDKQDYKNCVRTLKRLDDLSTYLPDTYKKSILAEELFISCNIKKDEDLADDLMEQLEKYLYKENSLTNLRVKLAYIVYVLKEKEQAEKFLKKAEIEIEKSQIKGLALYEQGLIEKIKEDI